MTYTLTSPSGTIYTFYKDLLAQNHVLIAGESGSGKSVLLNGLLHTAITRFPGDAPGHAQFIFLDAKGTELDTFRLLPHTLYYAVTPEEISNTLRYAEAMMNLRFKEIRDRRERRETRDNKYQGSDIYIVIDEFVDIIMQCGKSAVNSLLRLSSLGRSARIHVILCTQCPKANILPTGIKCNFEARVGLHTMLASDSRNIIEVSGCEKLPQHGKALYKSSGKPIQLVTIPFVTMEQVDERVDFWLDQLKDEAAS